MVAFGETLAANLRPEWRDKYVRYDLLKSVIEEIWQLSSSLGDGDPDDREVDQMIRVISSQSLLLLAERGEGKLASAAREKYSHESSYGSTKRDDGQNLRSRFWAIVETDIARSGAHASSTTAILRDSLEAPSLDLKALKEIHSRLVALQDFVRLNGVALRKAVKKYDKTVARRFGTSPSLPEFMDRLKTEPLMLCAASLVELEEIKLASLVSRDKLVSWKAEAHLVKSSTATQRTLNPVSFFFALFLFLALLLFPCVPEDLAASRSAAVVAFCVALWTTQAVPYHATAFAAPLLVVLFVKTTPSHDVLSVFFGESTFLLLGGYAVSASLSRCELEVSAAQALESLGRDSPKLYLLAIMLLGCLLSGVLSNSTSAVLCVSVVEPVLAKLDETSGLAKALLLGLAFACNAGGMLSPIASMQNIISVQALARADLELSFGKWCAIATPAALLSTLGSWTVLVLSMDLPPSTHRTLSTTPQDYLSGKSDDAYSTSKPKPKRSDEFRTRRILVGTASFVTVALWSSGAKFMGGVGMVSLGFMALAFGLGWLTVVDLNSLSWHTLCLLGGSNVLGQAVQSSNLLDYAADPFSRATRNMNHFALSCLVVAFVSTVSTFVSHTVSAIVVMPLVVQIAQHADDTAPLSIAAALAISAAQALPFSSLPNLNSLTRTDSNKNPFLMPADFVKYGGIAQLLSCLVVLLWAPLACALFLER